MTKKVKQILDDNDKAFGLTGHTFAKIRTETADLGMTKGTPFKGYCVHLPATDEFLGLIQNGLLADMRGFCSGPDKAMRFPSYKAAMNHCRPEKGETIIGLFETEHQFIVVDASKRE